MANRVSWTSSTSQLFLLLLLEEKSSGNWSGKSATTKGYENVSDKINRITGVVYNKIQMKNKFDTLRGGFHLWNNMFSGQTFTAYDYATGNVTMPDSWWESKIGKHGLQFGTLMYEVFDDSSATGAYKYTPTAFMPPVANPSGYDETRDGYETPPVTPRFDQDVSSPPRDVAGSSRLSGSKRKQSGGDSWKTTMESLNAKFSTVADQTEYVVKIVKTDENIEQFKTAIDILYSLPGVVLGNQIFVAGLKIIGDFNLRNVFLTLRSDADRLMFLQMHF